MKQSTKQSAIQDGKRNAVRKTLPKAGARWNFALFPLLLTVFLVPLIVRGHMFDSGLSKYAWYPDNQTEMDIFQYWKCVAVSVLAAVLLVFLCVLLIQVLLKRKPCTLSLRQDYWLFFLFGFGLMALLSTLLSPYRDVGLRGTVDSFETIWVVLAYCIILFYTYSVVRSERDLSAVRITLFALLVILGLLGTAQTFGLDPFNASFIQKLILPDGRTVLFGEGTSKSNKVYLAQGNSNFAAHFLSLILPVSTLMIFASEKIQHRVMWGVVTGLLFASTLGTGNRAFFLVLGVLILIGVFFLRTAVRRHWIATVSVLALVLIVTAVFFQSTAQERDEQLAVFTDQDILDDAKMEEEHVRFVYNGTPLLVSFEEQPSGLVYTFRDEDGTVLETYQNEKHMVCLADERFDGMQFMQYYGDEEHPFYGAAVIHNDPFLFKRTDTGYVYVTLTGKVDELVETPSALPVSMNSFVSKRGYIWSKTIPLLKDYLLLGSGAESFIYVFPNHDYLGRFNAGDSYTIINKPHSMYLQIFVLYGGVSLLLFLSIVLVYLIRSVKLYWHVDLQDPKQLLGVGIMLGILGYLAVGLANDSRVSVAPIFWFLLGLGFAVNRMVRKEQAEKN